MKRFAPYVLALAAWASIPVGVLALDKAMPAIYITLGQIGATGTTTLAVNTANVRQGFQFMLNENKTLSKVKQYVSAVTGTVSASGFVVALFSNNDVSQVPNASIESRSTVTTTPTGAGWVESTGFTGTAAITAGGKFWIVTNNATGTPASNFFTLRTVDSWLSPIVNGGGNGSWISRKTSTDGGTNWSAVNSSVASLRLEFSDGSFWGLPYETTAASPVGQGVYSTREHGIRFAIPASTGCYNVAGAISQVTITGSPTGVARFRLYNGTTLMDTSNLVNAIISNPNVAYFPAASTNTICGGGTYRIVLGETAQADASGNRFNLANVMDIENNADSQALMPWGAQQTYFDGSTWTDTPTKASNWTLILRTNAETPASTTTYYGMPLE